MAEEMFDLSNVNRLIESEGCQALVVVDTNVLMKSETADFSSWKTSAKEPVFLISDIVMAEIVMTHSKKETADAPRIARDRVVSLLKQGNIQDGIHVPDVGWFISVKAPPKLLIQQAHEQVPLLFEALGQKDTLLLLLTKDCCERIGNTPSVLITGDTYLYMAGKVHVSSIMLCDRFPCPEFEDWFSGTKHKPLEVDWEQELRHLQASIEKTSVTVEATLLSYKSAPEWLGTKSLFIAEGYGVVHDGNKDRPFLWTVPFYPKNIISSPKTSEESGPEFPSVHLDFLVKNDFDQNMFDGIADRIFDCANIHFEEGKPTLQSPESVMEMLIYMEYIFRNGASADVLGQLRQEVEESDGLTHYWTDWILGTTDEDERTACLEGFIEAVNGCWKMGQTYRFSIVLNR